MAGRLRVTLAGRVGLEIEGAIIPMTGLGRPARSALAYLTIHRERPVSRDELAEVLWGEELPQSWEQMLRGVIFKLRRLLGAAGLDANTVLTGASGAYRLQLPPDAVVDVEQAAESLEAAEAALGAGYAAAAEVKAAATLEVAGRQFAVDAAGLWVERRRDDLRGLQLRALDVLARAALAQGRCSATIDAAEKVLSIEPFRESAYVRLMEAHAQAGSRGEALRAYERCRRILAEELGVDPSTNTENVYLRLLGEDETDSVAPPGPAPLPLPSELAPLPGHLFVGREPETHRLEAAAKRAEIEGRQAVLITGEPGAGKTTLVAAVARAVHASGARVLYGRCDEELGVPYQPFAQALSHYVSTCPITELQAHCATWGGELARLVPVLARRLPELPPPTPLQEDDRWQLFEAVMDLLRRAASPGPLVLVLDDLHWAPIPTLLLLRHLLASPPTAALLLVGTYRHTETGPRTPLGRTLADLRRVPNVERMTLQGLNEQAVRAFVEGTGAFSPSDSVDLARALHSRTAGNPFFIEELLRHLGESRADFAAPADGQTGEIDVPDGVVDVVLRRLHRLSPTTVQALLVGSVIGAEFELDVLERASKAPADGVFGVVAEAGRAHLVEELGRPGGYRFGHGVVRQALYATLSGARRARMHRDVGYALESIRGGDPSHLPALAHHFAEAASCGCAPKAADYALAAARVAIRDAAWEQALTLVQRGIDALARYDPDDATRMIDLQMLLGDAQRRAGMPEHRETLLEAARLARSAEDAQRLAEAAGANNRGYCSVSWAVDTARVEMLESALAAEGLDVAMRARLLGNLAAETLYSQGPEHSRRLSDEALVLARTVGDPAAVAAVLSPRFNILRGDPGTLREREANAREFVAAAERGADRALLELAWGWRALTAMESADREESELSFRHWQRLDIEVRQPTLHWYLTYSMAGRQLFLGRIEEADRLSRDALVLGTRAGHPDARLVFGSQQFQIRLEQGRLSRLDRSMRQSTWEASALPREQALHLKRAALAEVYRALGQRSAAAQVFATLATNGFEDFARLPSWPYTIAACANVCAYVGDRERAAVLFDRILPYADQVVTLASLAYCGSVCHYLAMLAAALGRQAQADELFEEATRVHERMGAVGWRARTQLERARVIVEARKTADLPRARELLHEAVAAGSSLGLAPVEREAKALLESMGDLTLAPSPPSPRA